MPQTAAMRRIAILLIALFAAAGSPLAAQRVVYEEVIEETGIVPQPGSDRLVEAQPSPALPGGIATYFHAHLASDPGAAKAFVESCLKHKVPHG